VGKNNSNWIDTINYLGSRGIPFIFLVDFELEKPLVFPLDQVPSDIWYDFNGISNYKSDDFVAPFFEIEKYPIGIDQYCKGFNLVKDEIHKGNSFLLNLSFPTKIVTSLTLEDIFKGSKSRYKLKHQDNWTVFSPESFIRIKNNKIYSYPMKGTINADLPNAAQIILADRKETAEHHTIIDLIRNDLSRVAKKVKVSKYRYLDKITTHDQSILQVSSEIEGVLPQNYHQQLGSILAKLLPAGSISGAPKPKTVEIIQEVEGQKRGYYTGIAGIFDGQNLDSCVLIRFIEQINNEKFFRSGGGITHLSDVHSEYQELIDKVYVPIRRDHTHPEWKSQKYKIPQQSM
jgi:para-aminobenzoate synthetase component 1